MRDNSLAASETPFASGNAAHRGREGIVQFGVAERGHEKLHERGEEGHAAIGDCKGFVTIAEHDLRRFDGDMARGAPGALEPGMEVARPCRAGIPKQVFVAARRIAAGRGDDQMAEFVHGRRVGAADDGAGELAAYLFRIFIDVIDACLLNNLEAGGQLRTLSFLQYPVLQ